MQKTPEERFWSKVNLLEPTPKGCWLWTAAIDTPGYGAFIINGKKRNSHRIAYELTYGPIDRNMDIMHKCDVRLCCNPDHLVAGTRLQNVQDAQLKNRLACGTNVGSSKINEPMVRMIRHFALLGLGQAEIAKISGLNRKIIHDVVKGNTWAHVAPLDTVFEREVVAS